MRIVVLAAILAVTEGQVIGVQVDTAAAEITACNDQQCNQACKAIQWKEGFCKDGQCWCWTDGVNESYVERLRSKIETRINSASASISETVQCRNECRSRRYSGGAVKGGQCMCRKFTVQGMWLHDPPTSYRDRAGNQVAGCADQRQCVDACVHERAHGGVCMKDVCWCSVSQEIRSIKPITELQENVTENSVSHSICKPKHCNQECLTANRERGGVCVLGYCWCADSKRETKWENLNDIPIPE